MKITCDLTSLDKAAKQIEDYKKSLPKKLKEVAKNLAEIGVKRAQEVFGGTVSVTAKPNESGYTIYAEGRAVCFLEFGTGMYANSSNIEHYEYGSDFKVGPGEWSESEEGAHLYSKWLETHDSLEGWNYKGLPLNHVATPGMFEAYLAVSSAVTEEVKKVFA